MGRGFEFRAAHPCPTQIWVPPRIHPGTYSWISTKFCTVHSRSPLRRVHSGHYSDCQKMPGDLGMSLEFPAKSWQIYVSTGFKGIHHYYTLHRLSVQIEVPSRGSISKKKLVCLYIWYDFFQTSVFYNIFKNEIVFCVYFFWSENIAISRYHDSLIAPIRLVCSCATQIFKK